MRPAPKALLVGLLTALTFAGAISSTSARRIELSYQHFLAVWEPLTFTGTGGVINPVIKCRVTLEGSFHSRTLSKVCGQLVGYITEANVTRPCVQNEGWVLNGVERLSNGMRTANTLPWHIQYVSFSGTLPRITQLTFQAIGVAFLGEAAGLSCLFQSSQARPVFLRATVEVLGAMTQLTAEGSIPRAGGPAETCPAAATPAGTTIRFGRSPEFGEEEYRPITVRLVQ